MKIAIFGAKSIALGCFYALSSLYTEYETECFLVSTQQNNPSTLAGLPVIKLRDFNDKNIKVVIAVPESLHNEIITYLKENGFNNYVALSSEKENLLMKKYYKKIYNMKFADDLKDCEIKAKIKGFAVKSHKDKKVKALCSFPKWVHTLQVGCALTDIREGEYFDITGENISEKNMNYCELTALYWIWKNQINFNEEIDYYGLFHYRRMLDIKEADIDKLLGNNVDVVLPHPMLHEPNIKEHHERYVDERDWNLMLKALSEIEPEYRSAYDEIFSQQCMYNYNMIIAKPQVLDLYCRWLFPILERTEELCVHKENNKGDRYIAYIGESLLSLYFMYNRDKFKIIHTGRFMFV